MTPYNGVQLDKENKVIAVFANGKKITDTTVLASVETGFTLEQRRAIRTDLTHVEASQQAAVGADEQMSGKTDVTAAQVNIGDTPAA